MKAINEGQCSNEQVTLTKSNKPVVKSKGLDGNIFAVLGAAAAALHAKGQMEAAEEMWSKATKAGSYDDALQVIMDYVDFK